VPELKLTLPQGPDIPWVDKQWAFNGRWIPDSDPAMIGPQNYATLTNFRYNDTAIEGVGGYTRINETTALSSYPYIRTGIQLRTNRTTTSHMLVHAVDTSSQGRVYLNTTALDTQGDFSTSVNLDVNGNAYFEDTTTGLEGRFSHAPQQSVVYCNERENLIYSSDEQRIAAAFLVTDTPSLSDPQDPKDVTDALNSSLTSEKATFSGNWGTATDGGLLIMTTRPIQGIKIYMDSTDLQSDNNEALLVTTWDGTQFATVAHTDGTIADGQSLRQTGTIAFDSHSYGTSKLFHYQELYLYAYLIQTAAGTTGDLDCSITQVSVDMAMQPVGNIWDGVYRQPIQFQVDIDGSSGYKDYTLHVNQSSDISTPVGAELDSLTTNGEIIVMFEEIVSGIRFLMAADKLNTASKVIETVKYWDGEGWQTLTDNDDTIGASGKSFSKSGLVSWTPPAEGTEQKRTLFGSVGYAYQIKTNGTLSGDVIVDLVLGVPQPQSVGPFKFPVLYQNRLMLGGYVAGGEGNRMDFSVSGAPDVWNGSQSSKDGQNSLYFGGVEPLTGAVQLYNRFGASVFSMLLVFKDTELYMLTGETPSDFTIYPVSNSVGCPAPQTIATAEVGFEIGGQGLTRNVAIWISHYGPMMFDGAMIKPINGIGNYFDPSESEYVEWDVMNRSRAWVDQTYKEYNLLIPSGSGATNCNIWLVYDLIRGKWYQKDTGAAETPQSGWNVMDPSTGEQMVYGGINTGYMVHLEDGTSWNATKGTDTDGTGIEQVVKTGDFFPSDNIWDFCIQRKLKVLCRKLPESSTATTLQLLPWGNASESGSNIVFQDADAAAGINVNFEDMDVDDNDVNETEWVSAASETINLTLNIGQTRIIRLIKDLNEQGWVHAWEFSVTTTDAVKGWQPLFWGIQYYVSRKDNKAT